VHRIDKGKVMQVIARRWLVVMTLGLLMLLISGIAMAQQAQPAAGPDWAWIASGCVGVITLLVGAYAKGIQQRVDGLEREQRQLRDLLLREYHSKSDGERVMQDRFAVLRAELQSVTAAIALVHDRLNRMKVPTE